MMVVTKLKLTADELFVVENRINCPVHARMTLADLAKVVGVTKNKARQMEAKIIRKARMAGINI